MMGDDKIQAKWLMAMWEIKSKDKTNILTEMFGISEEMDICYWQEGIS